MANTDSNKPDPVNSAIDLTGSDDEDEDLKLAIALSLQDQSISTFSEMPHAVPSVAATIPLTDSTASKPSELTDVAPVQQSKHQEQSRIDDTTCLSGLNRKQMEAERLARLKRKRDPLIHDRSISPPPLRRNQQPSIPIAYPVPSHTKRALSPRPLHQDASLASSKPADSSTNGHLQYPTGKILLTSLNKSQKQSTSLSCILEPAHTKAKLKSALLSTFIVKFDWLLPHFDTRTVSFVLALHAQDDSQKRLTQQDFVGIPNVRLIFPYVGGVVNCMHSKIMILFYEGSSNTNEDTRCRIVIPSANLVPWDWGVNAVMENMLFVIDLPLRKDTQADAPSTKFKEGLVQALHAMTVPADVTRKLDQFDFKETQFYEFVHTIGGSHLLTTGISKPSINRFFDPPGNKAAVTPTSTLMTTPPAAVRTGLIALSDSVRSLGLAISRGDASFPPRLDYITSSIGNLKASFLESLILAACGNTPEISTKVKKSANVSTLPALSEQLKVYFPSHDTVICSKGGPSSAGTICFQSKWWDSSITGFPKDILHDCVGVRRDGVLMHSKTIFVRFARPKTVVLNRNTDTVLSDTAHKHTPDDTRGRTYAGWAYVGSANLSESAWGSLVTDSKTKQPKLNCRNWEAGVLIPVLAKPEHEGLNLHDLSLQEVFGHVVPVPMEYPAVNLVESGKQPWFFRD